MPTANPLHSSSVIEAFPNNSQPSFSIFHASHFSVVHADDFKSQLPKLPKKSLLKPSLHPHSNHVRWSSPLAAFKTIPSRDGHEDHVVMSSPIFSQAQPQQSSISLLTTSQTSQTTSFANSVSHHEQTLDPPIVVPIIFKSISNQKQNQKHPNPSQKSQFSEEHEIILTNLRHLLKAKSYYVTTTSSVLPDLGDKELSTIIGTAPADHSTTLPTVFVNTSELNVSSTTPTPRVPEHSPPSQARHSEVTTPQQSGGTSPIQFSKGQLFSAGDFSSNRPHHQSTQAIHSGESHDEERTKFIFSDHSKDIQSPLHQVPFGKRSAPVQAASETIAQISRHAPSEGFLVRQGTDEVMEIDEDIARELEDGEILEDSSGSGYESGELKATNYHESGSEQPSGSSHAFLHLPKQRSSSNEGKISRLKRLNRVQVPARPRSVVVDILKITAWANELNRVWYLGEVGKVGELQLAHLVETLQQIYDNKDHPNMTAENLAESKLAVGLRKYMHQSVFGPEAKKLARRIVKHWRENLSA